MDISYMDIWKYNTAIEDKIKCKFTDQCSNNQPIRFNGLPKFMWELSQNSELSTEYKKNRNVAASQGISQNLFCNMYCQRQDMCRAFIQYSAICLFVCLYHLLAGHQELQAHEWLTPLWWLAQEKPKCTQSEENITWSCTEAEQGNSLCEVLAQSKWEPWGNDLNWECVEYIMKNGLSHSTSGKFLLSRQQKMIKK